MSREKFRQLLELIQKNNGWKDSYGRDNLGKVPFIKYVTSHYDTRDATIYRIIIRDGESKESKIFKTETEADYDNIIDYLEGRKSRYELGGN